MVTIFDNENVKVERNGADEIFVTPKARTTRGTYLRISPQGTVLVITGQYGTTYIPTSVNGLPGFVVTQR